jgi:hypothetical protein
LAAGVPAICAMIDGSTNHRRQAGSFYDTHRELWPVFLSASAPFEPSGTYAGHRVPRLSIVMSPRGRGRRQHIKRGEHGARLRLAPVRTGTARSLAAVVGRLGGSHTDRGYRSLSECFSGLTRSASFRRARGEGMSVPATAWDRSAPSRAGPGPRRSRWGPVLGG